MLVYHTRLLAIGFEAALQHRAAQRSLRDVTIGPVLTWTTKAMLDHVEALLQIPGARRVFGGRALVGHQIPDCYGAIEPTAVYVPLREVLSPQNFSLVTKEVFGPVQVWFGHKIKLINLVHVFLPSAVYLDNTPANTQVLTSYDDGQVDDVLEACERMDAHLTAAIVSNDVQFVQRVLGRCAD